MSRRARRIVQEPGGLLLIGLGLGDDALQAAIQTLYARSSSLTVLVSQVQAKHAARIVAEADEIWVYAPLGLRGFIALMRRISWRRFEAVYQPMRRPFWLKYLVWPRPPWHESAG